MLIHTDPSSNAKKGSPPGSPNTEYITFTDKGIKHLEPGKSRRIVWARGLKGFGLRITPNGTKSFVFKYDVEGQDRWLTFGRYPKMKLAEALRKYGEALERVQEGDDPAEESVRINRAIRKALTVRQLADDYLDKYAKPRKRSWQEDDRILERDVLPRWGSRKASSITRHDVITLLDEIVARGARIQANRTLAVVRKMFNFAVDRDVLKASPCHRIKPPSPETSKDRYLTLDEMKAFWLRIDTAPLARRTKLALKLLAVTLQRTSEVLSINRSELDLRARTWIIPGSKTKNKRSHLVPLSPLAMEIVTELLKERDDKDEDEEDRGFLFPGEGRKGGILTKSAISRAIASPDHASRRPFSHEPLQSRACGRSCWIGLRRLADATRWGLMGLARRLGGAFAPPLRVRPA